MYWIKVGTYLLFIAMSTLIDNLTISKIIVYAFSNGTILTDYDL